MTSLLSKLYASSSNSTLFFIIYYEMLQKSTVEKKMLQNSIKYYKKKNVVEFYKILQKIIHNSKVRSVSWEWVCIIWKINEYQI